MRSLREIADALAASCRAIAPGRKLTQAEVEIINALAELFHRREHKTRFDHALAHVLKHEGGFVHHPKDPGGATNKGVTQATYDDWRVRQGLPKRSVRQIEAAEISAIYKREYWDRVRGDDLPAGVDYAVFDLAVNSGVSRAARFLQEAAGVAQDGIIGPQTIAAAKADPDGVVERLMDRRLRFLRGLETWNTFGRGWTTRCSDVRRIALEMAG